MAAEFMKITIQDDSLQVHPIEGICHFTGVHVFRRG